MTTEREREEQRRLRNIQSKQRALARQLLDTAVNLRSARLRLNNMANGTRPDIHESIAFRDLRGDGLRWIACVFELAARVALPPWTATADAAELEADNVPDSEMKPPAN